VTTVIVESVPRETLTNVNVRQSIGNQQWGSGHLFFKIGTAGVLSPPGGSFGALARASAGVASDLGLGRAHRRPNLEKQAEDARHAAHGARHAKLL
jgi:hypothetical protein